MTKNDYADIIILPAPNCRRSKKVLEFLETERIPHQVIDLTSPQGIKLTHQHHFLASPGILINGSSINPYEILNPEQCRVERVKAINLFTK